MDNYFIISIFKFYSFAFIINIENVTELRVTWACANNGL